MLATGKDDFTLEEYDTWLAYENCTGKISGARQDFQFALIARLLCSEGDLSEFLPKFEQSEETTMTKEDFDDFFRQRLAK